MREEGGLDESLRGVAGGLHHRHGATRHLSAGWYLDPSDAKMVRWWDGARWTHHTHPRPQLAAPQPAVTESITGPAGATPAKRRINLVAWMAMGVAICVAGASAWVFLSEDGRRDTAYLKSLRNHGLGGQFSSDVNAVAAGRAFCEKLRHGGEQEGWPADKVAVTYYCPEFDRGFKVLRELTVRGSLTLLDASIYSSAIAEDGVGGCEGTGPYGDLTAGTSVVLKGSTGQTLVTVPLGPGTGDSVRCTFEFTLPVKEGESDYVLSISHRGEQHYTFTQLEHEPPNLSIGE